MRAVDRENQRYNDGSINPIALEEEIMMSLLNKEGARILDIGCGIGTIGLLLKSKGHSVVGVDFSRVAIEKSNNSGLDAIEVDVDESGLPFEDEQFDVVWAGDIVEHVFDPIALLMEGVRTMKDDGIMLFSVPNDITLKRRLKICMYGISPQTEVYRGYGQCKHHTVMSYELLMYFISQSGLQAENILGIFKAPWKKESRVIESKVIARSFAQTFIVRAVKK
jgi:2-polyprenyl-3-methyl-5-hydroxy-6-metoxy-1,4-benzoquinol methylase